MDANFKKVKGDGTTADNTIMMAINGGGPAHHFGRRRFGYGVVVLGNLGGALETRFTSTRTSIISPISTCLWPKL
ncbi:MAG: hypothetical protein ACI9KE_003880 [Polyangiales bacterium]|jgi:hypothetical protein